MAIPSVGVGDKLGRSNHSPLMEALSKAGEGNVVNFCPYGCETGDLDENGYCYHLVGFTVPGVDKVMEPQVMGPHGRYQIQLPRERVRPTDHLEKITVSSRVYRKDAPRPSKPDDILDDVLAEEMEYQELEKEDNALAAVGIKQKV